MPGVINFEEAKKPVGPRGPDRHSPYLSPERCALLQAFWNWHCLAESEDVPEVGELMHCVLLSTTTTNRSSMENRKPCSPAPPAGTGISLKRFSRSVSKLMNDT
jgi:hypothetical protein